MVDWDFIDYSGFSRSPLDAWYRSDVDEVKLDLRNIQSMELMDPIHSDHLDSGKKISQSNLGYNKRYDYEKGIRNITKERAKTQSKPQSISIGDT